MKKKYVLCLVVIGIMFLFVLTAGTGYGLWLATSDNTGKVSTTLNCFKVYFSNGDTIEMRNIDTVVNEEGVESAPNTLTITNICKDRRELQVRLNILEDSTVDVGALTIQAAGNIERDITLYKNLSNAKSTENGVLQSKIIGLALVEPNETVRTNIKMWFDEKKAPNLEKDLMLRARFELIDTESSVKASFAEYLITNTTAIEKKGNPDFSRASLQEEGMFASNIENGKTYYYRGAVNNNYVKFANQMWRIVRINSDGTIRLILDKSATFQKYSNNVNYMDYTGLKYLYNDGLVNNNVMVYLEDWYNNVIVSKGLDKYVDNSMFCNDSSYTTTNYHTYFGGFERLVTSYKPSFICKDTTADFGGKYNQKIGIISADEVALAGGLYETNNQKYYLYNGENFFTSTPSEYYYYNAYVFTVSDTGALQSTKINTEYGIRPVISLVSTVTVSGRGTIDDPYTIDM